MIYDSSKYTLEILDKNINKHNIALNTLSNTNSIEISNIQITITADTTTGTSLFGFKDALPDTFTLDIINID